MEQYLVFRVSHDPVDGVCLAVVPAGAAAKIRTREKVIDVVPYATTVSTQMGYN